MAIDRMKNPDPDPKKKYGTKDEDDIVNWYRKYYNSDLFRKNLYDPQMPGSGYSLGQWSSGNPIPSQKNKDIGKLMTNYVTKVKTYYPGTGATMADDNSIDMGDPSGYYNQPKSSMYAHEMAHVGQDEILNRQPSMLMYMLNKNKKWNRKDYANDLAKELNAPKLNYEGKPAFSSEEAKKESILKSFNQDERGRALLGPESHDSATHEIRSDIMALRYLAAQNSIWDAAKSQPGSFTPEMLNKLYKNKDLNVPLTENINGSIQTTLPSEQSKKQGNLKEVAPPKNPGVILQRLRKRFNDDELLYLMNRIAKNQLPSNLQSMKDTDYSS